VKYAIGIPANDSLERDIAKLRPAGRPSHKPVVWYKTYLYQAASWKTARRVVTKVEFHFGDLSRVGFIVTNLETDSRADGAVPKQAQNGRAVDQAGQAGGQDDQAQLSSVPAQRGAALAERARVQPGNLWRRLVPSKRIENWPLTNLQQRLVKTGGKRIKHARCYWLILAESHLTRRLYGSMVRRIGVLVPATV
jgi:hypothetical protein